MKDYLVFNQDCMEWMKEREADSVHAVCTDPPYGLIEFSPTELTKLRSGKGGIWRLPPNINGCRRDPLPRFTVLSDAEKANIEEFFVKWGELIRHILMPGGHVLVAGNSYLQHYVQRAMWRAGFGIRGTIVRVYQGFRGGDRPKNAEKEFPDVCVTAKGYYEPWMLFRKPISEGTVAANLRRWKTGGLRMLADGRPFPEVVMSGRTPKTRRGACASSMPEAATFYANRSKSLAAIRRRCGPRSVHGGRLNHRGGCVRGLCVHRS